MPTKMAQQTKKYNTVSLWVGGVA